MTRETCCVNVLVRTLVLREHLFNLLSTMQKCAQLGKVIEQQLKAHRHEVQDGVPQGTFHMFLTKRPSNPQACRSYSRRLPVEHS